MNIQPITVQFIWTAIKKGWWFVVLLTCASVGSMYAINQRVLVPIYANYSTVLVNDQKQVSDLSYDDLLVYEKLLETYKNIITSRKILQEVIDGHQLNVNVNTLRSKLKVSHNANSQVLKITVTDPSYRHATDLANWVTETFQSKLKEVMTVDNVQILDKAELKKNAAPVGPRYKLNLALSFLFGFLLSIGIVLLYRILDKRIRHEEELAEMIEYPLLGTIPNFESGKEKLTY